MVGAWSVHGDGSTLLERAGLSPLAILTAATWTPAQMLGMEEELGTIEEGKRADLLIVEGDPLSDASVLLRPNGSFGLGIVVHHKNGWRVRNSLKSLLAFTFRGVRTCCTVAAATCSFSQAWVD